MIINRILLNKQYQYFIKILMATVVIISFISLSLTVFNNFFVINILEKISMIIFYVFSIILYLIIMLIIWKKR